MYVGEEGKQIPFLIKRFYFIRDMPASDAVRGAHAHKTLDQAIFCLGGSFELQMDDGLKKWNVLMDDPSRGYLLPKRVWHSMSKFSKDCVILVVASQHHDESDYLRDYNDFLKHISENS